MIDDCVFILINVDNPNIEKKAGFYMGKIESNAANIWWFGNKIIILGGDFNLYLDSELKAEGGSPVLKKSSVSKLI